MSRPRMPIGTWGDISARRVNGRWEARAYYRAQDGRRRLASARGSTAAAAKNRLKARLAELVAYPNSSVQVAESLGPTLLEVCLKWLEFKNEEGFASNTLLAYSQAVRAIGNGIGAEVISSVTSGSIAAFLNELSPGVEPLVRSTLVQVYRYAKAYDLVADNPAEGLPRRRVKTPEVRALTLTELTQLRAALRKRVEEVEKRQDTNALSHISPAHYVYWIMELLVATGCRPGEILALRWNDVDLISEPPRITICGTVIRTSAGSIRQPHTKTKKSRTLLLPVFAVRVLEDIQSRDLGNAPDQPVIPARDASWLLLSTAARWWRSIRSQLDPVEPNRWEWVTFRTIRKTVATLVDNEVSDEAAAAQLGHSGTYITHRHYIEEKPSIGPDLTDLWRRIEPGGLPS